MLKPTFLITLLTSLSWSVQAFDLPGCLPASPPCVAIISGGCTDPLACNYDPEATEDDGSCLYPGDVGGCVTIPYNPDENGDQLISVSDLVSLLGYYELQFIPAQVEVSGMALSAYIDLLQEAAANADGETVIIPSMIPGTEMGQMLYWDGAQWALLNPGSPGESLKMGSDQLPQWSPGGALTDTPTIGCPDPLSCNYDPTAEIVFNELCEYETCYGCTDSLYLEFDPLHTFEDSSCATLVVPGCTDPAYLEFDPVANQYDGSCAILVVLGCTDSLYIEFTPEANTDDGTCLTEIVLGCTDSTYVEFNPAANVDDGSCATLVVLGCTDSLYIEFTLEANIDDGTCLTEIVLGCTDSAYVEFNPASNVDDGSCATLVVLGCTDSLYIEFTPEANTDDGTCLTETVLGCTDSTYVEFNPASNVDDGSCATLVVLGCTDSLYIEFTPEANTDDGTCLTETVLGCTDSTYVEFNPASNVDDESCTTFVVLGCTDSLYIEFNPEANTDDGTCFTEVVLGCTDSNNSLYAPEANQDDGSCSVTCFDPSMDGHTYDVIQIGSQCWFAENLRTSVYGDEESSPIPFGLTSADWVATCDGATAIYGEGDAGCFESHPILDACDEVGSLAEFGRLYNWFSVIDARGVCPSGWRVPSDEDWMVLKDFITTSGFQGGEGAALKSTSGWNGDNGTDDFSFSGLASGARGWGTGNFVEAGDFGRWWSSSISVEDFGWAYTLTSSDPILYRNSFDAHVGMSVRCLLDGGALGCTDSLYVEFNPAANIDDGSCFTLVVPGCTDSDYANYNAEATSDDASCSGLLGCTDIDAFNYNPDAEIDDGLCSQLIIALNTDNYGPETSWTLIDDVTGMEIASGSCYLNNSAYEISVDVATSACYTFTIVDSYGDGICCSYGQGNYSLTLNGVVIADGGDFGYDEETQFCAEP